MKKITFVLLFSFISLFVFSQSNKKETVSLKEKSVLVVEFMEEAVGLNKKQKTVFMNAFAEYANVMTKATKKMEKKYADSDSKTKSVDSRKELNTYALRAAEKRNAMINDCLTKKQIKLYGKVIQDVHPLTLKIRQKKDKKK
mgnify:CR=1 FL=1